MCNGFFLITSDRLTLLILFFFLDAFNRVSFRRKKKEGKEKGEAAKSPTSPKEEKVSHRSYIAWSVAVPTMPNIVLIFFPVFSK